MIKRRIKVLVFATVAALSLFAYPSAATAQTPAVTDSAQTAFAPTNCLSAWKIGPLPPGYFKSICWGGSGIYRAIAFCETENGLSLTLVTGRFEAVGSNRTSTADCPHDYPVLRNGWTDTLG